MGGTSIWHWLILGAVALLLFGGRGKISDLMGDVAKGIKSFKKGMAEDEAPPAAQPPVVEPPRIIDHQTTTARPEPMAAGTTSAGVTPERKVI